MPKYLLASASLCFATGSANDACHMFAFRLCNRTKAVVVFYPDTGLQANEQIGQIIHLLSLAD